MFDIPSFLTDTIKDLLFELVPNCISDRLLGNQKFRYETTLIKPRADTTDLNVLKVNIELPTKAVPLHMWPGIQKTLERNSQPEEWNPIRH